MLITDTNVFCWHPRFRRHELSETALLLIAENENYILEGDQYTALFRAIDGGASLDSFLEQYPHLGSIVQNLLKKKLLTTSSEGGYHLEAYPLASEPTVLQLDDQLVYNLSIIDLPLDFIKKLPIPKGCVLVITDDYLHPHLAQINQTEQPLLLLKLTGKRYFVGPYFPKVQGAPCWQCMASQLLNNQPVRKWLQAKKEATYLPLPVFDLGVLPDAPNVAKVIQQVIDCPHTLFEVDPVEFTSVAHGIRHRSQCATCGNPDLMTQQMTQPISLDDGLTSLDNDGGSRMVDAPTTVQTLQALISPLTGCITHIQRFTKATETAITIHQAAFFKTPAVYQSIHPNAFVQPTLGKGIDRLQSQASALGEALERYAAHFQGDEYWIKSKPDDLDARYYLPNTLVNFSDTQYKSFAQLVPTDPEYRYAVQQYDPTIPLTWVPAWSLTAQEKVWIPFNYSFAQAPFEADHQYIRWNSNGCAAGNNLEEAILQGFFELVERDAIALWWYNKIKRPAVDLDALSLTNQQKFQQALTNWNYWVLDITTDFGIPVMAGIAQNPQTGKFCLGFGCHFHPVIACQRALAELCQLLPIRDQNQKMFDFDAIQPEAFLQPNGFHKGGETFVKPISQNLKEDILHCVQKAREQGLETLVLDYSRPDLPLSTVKVVVPGLCHMWPQLGTPRLYEVPVKLGWLQEANMEASLHHQALYI